VKRNSSLRKCGVSVCLCVCVYVCVCVCVCVCVLACLHAVRPVSACSCKWSRKSSLHALRVRAHRKEEMAREREQIKEREETIRREREDPRATTVATPRGVGVALASLDALQVSSSTSTPTPIPIPAHSPRRPLIIDTQTPHPHNRRSGTTCRKSLNCTFRRTTFYNFGCHIDRSPLKNKFSWPEEPRGYGGGYVRVYIYVVPF